MNAMKVSESHINVGQQFNYKWVNGLTLEYLINVYDQSTVLIKIIEAEIGRFVSDNATLLSYQQK